MKILQINATVNSGSTGRIAEDIGQVLLAKGHESYIAYGRGHGSSQSELIRIGNKWSVVSHVLRTRLFDEQGYGSVRATKRLIQEIEKIQPDVIGLHNLHGYYLNIKVLFCYLAKNRLPVTWTLHDCWAFTGHCSFYDNIDCYKWENECNTCPKINKYPGSLFLDNSKGNFLDKKKLYSHLHNICIITPSVWLYRELEKSILSHVSKTVIYNGIDLNSYSPQNVLPRNYYELIRERKIILGVANVWQARKGLPDFLELSKMIPDKMVIVLIGLTPYQIKKLPPGIIGISRTEDLKELAAWYSAADVFVNPTYLDNFPTTNIEALACGTPVITYNTGGSPEAVDEKTGMVVEKGNIRSLWLAVETVLNNGKETYSAHCRARALRLFNKEARYHDYLDIYKELIAESGR